jgi:hypothetical protein
MNALRYLSLLILAILRPAVEGEELEPELDLQGGEPEPEPQGEPEPEGGGEPEPEPEPKVDRAAIEREVSEKYERELATLRANQRPPALVADPEFEREEAILKNPEATPLEKWQVTANRELRAGRQASTAALAQAYDVSDKTAFAALATTEPALYKKYSPLVEQRLAEMRRSGQNTTRENIYTFLLGKDMREGKFTKKSKNTPAGTTINRGKLPGARSDVGGKNGMSDREKRAARLENVQI